MESLEEDVDGEEEEDEEEEEMGSDMEGMAPTAKRRRLADTPVARLQPEGMLRHQSVRPILPAYNKFMAGVDRTDQCRRTYWFDRKSKHYWLRIFFQFSDYAINNAYLLYKHSCHAHKLSAMDLLSFRLELVHLLLEQAGPKRDVVRARKVARDAARSARVCDLDRVSSIVYLKRGRCHYCQIKKKQLLHYTSFRCTVCRVRLCKTPCFAKFHHH